MTDETWRPAETHQQISDALGVDGWKDAGAPGGRAPIVQVSGKPTQPPTLDDLGNDEMAAIEYNADAQAAADVRHAWAGERDDTGETMRPWLNAGHVDHSLYRAVAKEVPQGTPLLVRLEHIDRRMRTHEHAVVLSPLGHKIAKGLFRDKVKNGDVTAASQRYAAAVLKDKPAVPLNAVERYEGMSRAFTRTFMEQAQRARGPMQGGPQDDLRYAQQRVQALVEKGVQGAPNRYPDNRPLRSSMSREQRIQLGVNQAKAEILRRGALDA